MRNWITSVLALMLTASAGAQVRTSARPAARITAAVDGTLTTVLSNSHPAAVDRAAIGPRLPAATPLSHLRLVLSATDDQEFALSALLQEQQDKTSQNYHQWLNPDSFGQFFGTDPADVARVTAWLQSQGFAIESVSRSNRIVSFGGNVGQVETAFHTQMNELTVDGETHISNVTDVSIPVALAPVVRGVESLNNFFPKAHKTVQGKVEIDKATGKPSPQYTSPTSAVHQVGPGDVATIYNSTPLTSAGIDGTGITIAVLGRSDVTLSDVQQFRSMFGLKKNDPTLTILGNDPGIDSDDEEAYLDVEWSGAMAPGAAINFIEAGPDYYTSNGINAAGLYAVDNNIGDIISLSYYGCETNNGSGNTSFWNTLWEQAAAQGQSVFVCSGDSGAAGCASKSGSYGTAYSVNALGSGAYNVAVGGTMFVDYGPTQFWGSGVYAPAPAGYTFATALSYIPEAALNQGTLSITDLNTASTGLLATSGIFSTGGGISIYTARPTWQTGSGIPANSDPSAVSGTGIAPNSPLAAPHRLVPDVSMISASNHDGTIFCAEGVCSNTNTSYSYGYIGGTSVATPTMASVQALIDQKNGGRQGNPNFYFYALANLDYIAGNCKAINGTVANPTVTLPASTCNFHDVVAGSNIVQQYAGDTVGLGFNATTGFDPASGLGSLNIANVANNWSSVSLQASKVSFTLSPTITTHGTPQLFTIDVTAATGNGLPFGGDLSIVAQTGTPSEKLGFPLGMGTFSGTIDSLPAGSYNVHAHFSGNGVYAASDSASIPVIISTQASSVANTLHYISAAGNFYTNATSVPYGSMLFIASSVTPKPLGSTTVPTGKLTYGVTLNNSVNLASMTQTLDGIGNASLQSGATSTPEYLAGNYPVLSPGSYVLSASYGGDSTYTASSSSISFSITQVAPTVTLTSSASNISSGGTILFNYSVTRPSGTYVTPLGAIPSGSVSFLDSTLNVSLGNVTLNNAGLATLSVNSITSGGSHNIVATYSGDANYTPLNASVGVTVGTLTPTSTTLSVSAGTYYVGSTLLLSATVSPAASATVSFYDGSTYLGSATSSATGLAALSTTALTAGPHTLTASFGGTATYAASSGSTSLTVSQNITSLTVVVPAASTYGQTVALAGRISRNPSVSTPLVGLTGTVTFYDGNTVIATATPVYTPGYAYYTATASSVTLLPGSHTISVGYGGDANYAGSTSSTVTLAIGQLTPSIAISSTSSVYIAGTSVPLTATIPLSSALVAPSGSVTFFDGSTQVGAAALTYNAAAGAYVATSTATGLLRGSHSFTAALAPDSNYTMATSQQLHVLIETDNVWIANGNNSISALTQAGTALTPSAIQGGGFAISIDASGNVWSLNNGASAVAEYTSAGSLISSGSTVGGLSAPTALAIDGAGLVWVTNGNGTLSALTAPGTAVAPTAYQPSLSTPTSISIDGSGNLWITNSGDNSVTEVIGAAAPVTTPTTSAVTNNTLATKP